MERSFPHFTFYIVVSSGDGRTGRVYEESVNVRAFVVFYWSDNYRKL
jgi:hypothetical protein